MTTAPAIAASLIEGGMPMRLSVSGESEYGPRRQDEHASGAVFELGTVQTLEIAPRERERDNKVARASLNPERYWKNREHT